MKKFTDFIALSVSVAMLSLTSVSAFSVNAEEIPEPVYYSESETEPVVTTTTAISLPEFVTTTAYVTTTTYTQTSRDTGTDNDVPVLYGDANTDGCVDIADVVAVASYVADSEKNDIGGYGMLCGDVHNTGDGITANDALAIQKFLAGDSADFC